MQNNLLDLLSPRGAAYRLNRSEKSWGKSSRRELETKIFRTAILFVSRVFPAWRDQVKEIPAVLFAEAVVLGGRNSFDKL